VAQYFMPVDLSEQRAVQRFTEGYRGRPTIKSASVVYEPHFVALAAVTFADTRRAQSQQEDLGYLVHLPDAHGFIEWESGLSPDLGPRDLGNEPRPKAMFNTLPAGMTDSPPYTRMRDDLIDYIYRQHSLPLLVNEQLKMTSNIGESREAFIGRCQREAGVELRQAEDKERERLNKEIERLQQRLRREEQKLEQDRATLNGRRSDELLLGAETLIGVFTGRRRTTALSSAARRRTTTARARTSVRESEATIQQLQRDIADLERRREDAIKDLRTAWEGVAERVAEQPLRPRKTDIRISAYGLAWRPYWAIVFEDERGYVRDEFVPAYGAEPQERARRA